MSDIVDDYFADDVTTLDQPYANPKCPDCRHPVGNHFDATHGEYYCVKCQATYRIAEVIP